MRTLTLDEFERAKRRDWPRMMDVADIAELTGWTKLTIQTWLRDGQLVGARTLSEGSNTAITVPREVVLAQLDPRNCDQGQDKS